MEEKNYNDIIVGKEFPEKIIPLIREAKRSIDIIVYDWRWYPDQVGSSIQNFNNTLVRVVNRGIQCRVITNDKKTVEIIRALKFKVKRWSSKNLLHTKMIIIDDRVIVIGSHNYTMNAFTINHEVSLVANQKIFILRLKKYFNNLWQL